MSECRDPGPTLELNGEQVRIDEADPNTTLLGWLRRRGLTGTKEGCAEGECGACAVAIVEEVDGVQQYRSVNSCLLPLYAAVGRQVVTVEGVGDPSNMHPVQQAMVEMGGSQCGYCTPGFVVSMFSEYYRPGRGAFDLEAIGGNLCRCTGYRPIIAAAQKLPVLEAAGDDLHYQRLHPARVEALEPFETSAAGRAIARPTELSEALRWLAQPGETKVIAGGTDAVVEINQRHTRHQRVLLIDQLKELRGVLENDAALVIGACEPLANIEDQLHGRADAMDQLFPLFSSRLIRHRATLGGNLCNASPIGDGPPVLLALDASVEASSLDEAGHLKARSIELADFFTGYRQTLLHPHELLTIVRVPKPLPDISRFYKVSKRVLDDISTVAAAFALWFDGEHVRQARLAYGGVAATPVRAYQAEQALVGKAWNEQSWSEARALLQSAFTPMDDHRGSAKYRSEMVGRLFDKFFAQTHVRESAA